MAKVSDLIHDRKEVYSVQAEQTVYDAARFMLSKNIGAVAVLAGGGLAGIFSERDLLKRVVAQNLSPQAVRVDEVMTKNPTVVSPDHDLDGCLALMRQRGFRHLPVCEGKQFQGLLSLRDILLFEVSEKDGEVRMMRSYITQS